MLRPLEETDFNPELKSSVKYIGLVNDAFLHPKVSEAELVLASTVAVSTNLFLLKFMPYYFKNKTMSVKFPSP